ncbi:MAG: dienelactone hydrolase [Gemmatales bacterium]|nr:MAG: dienelactone hydrolase [Gemmatales bacterium]
MVRGCCSVIGVLLAVAIANAEVKTKTIVYQHGKVKCHGYLAWDDAIKGPRPGVLVVHEWWGLNDYARQRARQLASLGYVALAADMYGEGKTADHPKDASAMSGQVRKNIENWRQRALAALNTLKAQPQCDKNKLAAIGYCFGGSTVLQLAFSGADLKAVVSFHGALPAPTPEDVKRIRCAILVCHGADDRFIPEKAIKAFREPLDNAGVEYQFIAYRGAVHSFTVPDADKRGIEGIKYNKPADQDSWKRMLKLFKEKLGT